MIKGLGSRCRPDNDPTSAGQGWTLIGLPNPSGRVPRYYLKVTRKEERSLWAAHHVGGDPFFSYPRIGTTNKESIIPVLDVMQRNDRCTSTILFRCSSARARHHDFPACGRNTWQTNWVGPNLPLSFTGGSKQKKEKKKRIFFFFGFLKS